MYPCPQCEEAFETQRGASIHQSKSHSVPYDDASWLREKYHEEGMNVGEIAKDAGVTERTIYEKLCEHDIRSDDDVTCDECGKTFDSRRGKAIHYGQEHRNQPRSEKISEALSGRTWNIDHREKISNALRGRNLSEDHKENIRTAMEERDHTWGDKMEGENNPFFGESHDEETLEVIREKRSQQGSPWREGAKASDEARKRMSLNTRPPKPNWITVDETGHHVRSSWEELVDKALHNSEMQYEYEPQMFEIKCGSYYPDFVVEEKYVIEVKGYVDERSVQKATEFQECYPEYEYIVIGGDDAKSNMPYDHFIEYDAVGDKLNV